MRIQGILAMAVGMLLGMPAHASESQTVSGTIQITNTRVKTEGPKSDKEVVVYLENVGEATYAPPPEEHAKLDQMGLVFVPHVMAIQKGSTVDFLNSDTTDHNIFSVDTCCEFDLGNFSGGQKASHTFDTSGPGVMLCKLHPEMAAYIVVLDTSYFTIAEIDGDSQTAAFSIENVPPGNYTLKTWSKRCESADQEIRVAAGEETKVDIELQRKQRKKRRRR